MKKSFLLTAVLVLLLTGCGTTPTSNVSQATGSQAAQVASSAQSSQVGSKTAPQSGFSGITAFNWVDLKTDMVSPKADTPDGQPDGHFQLSITFNEPVAIKYIVLRCSAYGRYYAWTWLYDNRLPIAGYSMGVAVQGNLVPRGPDVGYKTSGKVDLDIFVPELNNENGRDTFKFEKGEQFNLTVTYITEKGNPGSLYAYSTVE